MVLAHFSIEQTNEIQITCLVCLLGKKGKGEKTVKMKGIIHTAKENVELFLTLHSSYSKAFNVTHVVKWENGKVVQSEMSWKALFWGFFATDIA